MGKKLQNAPVYFTIGQIQHNPLLGLDSFVSEIQERMRKLGYPDFSQEMQMGFSFSGGVGGDSRAGEAAAPAVQPVSMRRFFFCNMHSTAGFTLQQNSLSFQTTDYQTFENFLGELINGIELLNDVVGGLSFVDRLGLRYLDAVIPLHGQDLAQYLPSELMGLPARLKTTGFSYSFTEALVVLPNVGAVTTRTIIRNGQISFPQDLRPDPLKLSRRFEGANTEHAVIDTDASYSEREAMTIFAIKDRFTKLHSEIEKSFNATVTDFARASWT